MFDKKNFKKTKKFWYKGKFYPWENPVIHCMAHALHYGTSVFEGIRAYATSEGTAIFRLDEHIERLFYSASIVGMEIPYSKQEIISIIIETLKENKLNSAYIRPLVFYSYGNLDLLPHSCPVEVVISAWEWGLYLGNKIHEEGANVLILPMKRFHYSQIEVSAKIGGLYVQSQIGAKYAKRRGFDEGLFLNIEGNIAEGCGENIFIVKNGKLKTNNKKESILEGITQKSVIEIAKDLGLSIEIGKITKEEFLTADEAFFTGTAIEIAPITRVSDESDLRFERKEYMIGDGKPGRITLNLYDQYLKIVKGENKKYLNWLTYVK